MGYSDDVHRSRPGIAKAAPFPNDLAEDLGRGAVVRAILDDLDTLISGATRREWVAFGWGTPKRGGVRLMRASRGEGGESLRISWDSNEIERIEIESADDLSFHGPESPLDPKLAREKLVPMVWAHIRRGGELPPGIDRFAGLL